MLTGGIVGDVKGACCPYQGSLATSMNGPSSGYEITDLVFCANCADSRPGGMKMQHWSRLEVGRTPHGFQVWCTRCKLNVANIWATVVQQCTTRNFDENPTPGRKKQPIFGWKVCAKCGLNDRFGKGLFDQEICTTCGTETGDDVE